MKKSIDELNRMTHFEREEFWCKQEGHMALNTIMEGIDYFYDEELSDSFRTPLQDFDIHPALKGRYPRAFDENQGVLASVEAHIEEMKDWDITDEERGAILALKVDVFYHMFMWWKHGKKKYILYKEMVEQLNDVDCWKKTLGAGIRLPNKSIYLPLHPKTNIHRTDVNQRATGIYVTDMKGSETFTRYRILICFFAKKFELLRSEFSCDVTVDVEENEDIWTSIQKTMNRCKDSDMKDCYLKSIEFVFKTLIYINCVNAKIEKVDALKREMSDRQVRRKINKAPSEIPSYIVGGQIKIKPPVGSSKIYNKGGGVKHRYKYMVRGHFHSFWMNYRPDIDKNQIIKYGEQWTRQENKVLVRKFVEPYWKGDDFADIVHKDYIVEG